jgi:hypothetical protein
MAVFDRWERVAPRGVPFQAVGVRESNFIGNDNEIGSKGTFQAVAFEIS